MAIFQCDIEKVLNGEYWTNVYHVEADTLAIASNMAGEIAVAERTFHLQAVQFTKARIRTATEGDEIFVTRPLNFAGTVPVTSPIIPLFNTIRVDIQATEGRPSRKFYRGCLAEDKIDGMVVLDQVRDFVAQNLDSLITGNQGGAVPVNWVDVDGQPLVALSVFQPVQMRQLRRGSRKRTTPVI